MFRRLIAACAVALVLAGGALLAQQDDRARAEALSRRAADRMQALREEATHLAAEERTLLGDLRRLEVEREIRATELEQARSEVRAAANDLAAVDQQIAALDAQSTAALPDLRARLVTLYKLGRGRYARLLLSASDVRQFGQAARLVSALAEQDRQRVAQHQRRLADLNAARTAARERHARVQQLQAAAEQAEASVDQALKARTTLVRDIDTRRDLNAQFAGELLAAQQRLQATVAGLSTGDIAALPIAPFKGDLDWPVPGTVRQRFGATVAGRPPLRGIEIAAPEGSAVNAVHDGTVAYADTFTGYGRLVIVDHGKQTFTLYGNLGEIQAERGSHVERGSPVGTVGLAAGDAAAVYFELRVDGRAVDPLQWLGKR
jgi:murein hydrolase activator